MLLAPGVDRVIAVGRSVRQGAWDPILRVSPTDLRIAPFGLDDLRVRESIVGATSLLHLGPRGGLDIDGTGGSEVDIPGTESLLTMLDDVGAISSMVLLSTALVYGARRDNPVPLTEGARVRPNPSIPAAMERASLERRCIDWSFGHGVPCAVLRPSVVVGPDNGRWLARSPWSTSGLQVSTRTGPVQFIHVDDLVSAIDVVWSARADGPINVAPDGWLTASQVRALKGPTARLALRRSLALRAADLGARLGLAPGDPSTILASSAPWVVANDRLRSLGWAPSFTNEEAYVDSDRGGLWARLTPRHRQELALGAVGVLGLGLAGLLAVAVRRRLRDGSRGSRS